MCSINRVEGPGQRESFSGGGLMSHASPWAVVCRPFSLGRLVLILGLAPFGGSGLSVLTAADAQPGKAVAQCVTETGTVVRRAAPDKPWQVMTQKGTVNDGDLVMGKPGAMLDSANGAVRLTLMTDLDGQSPYPVHE